MRTVTTTETTIRELSRAEAEWLLPDLCDVLQDAVHHDASVGFLAPLRAAEASDYWHGVFAALSPLHRLWVAERDGRVVGTVQLARCGRANGRHRAEVQKLLVHTAYRRQGLARSLMEEAEQAAAQAGVSLLYLDTETGKPAVAMYRNLGYRFAGAIPGYAASPDGTLSATELYYKQLGASA